MSERYDGYGSNAEPVLLPEHPQGNLVLILGIIGVFVPLVAPFAWYLGSRILGEARTSGVVYRNQSEINIGRILGMIITIVLIIAVVFTGLVVGVLGVAAWSQS